MPGLGATFGGDSSVYRSRRGIEKRLFQFTVTLATLFVVFSIVTFKLGARPTSERSTMRLTARRSRARLGPRLNAGVRCRLRAEVAE